MIGLCFPQILREHNRYRVSGASAVRWGWCGVRGCGGVAATEPGLRGGGGDGAGGGGVAAMEPGLGVAAMEPGLGRPSAGTAGRRAALDWG